MPPVADSSQMADEQKPSSTNSSGGNSQTRNELTASLSRAYLDGEFLMDRARQLRREDLVADVEKMRDMALSLLTRLDEFSLDDTLWLTASHFAKKALSNAPLTDSATPKRRQRAASILLVDDDKYDLEAVGDFLRVEGYDVQVAQDGEYGLWMAQNKPVDLIVLDVQLPGMNGVQVLQQLKSDIVLRTVPVIMLSGMSYSEDVVKCIELGAEDFLAKPVNPILLRARIESGLERKRLHDVEKGYLDQLQIEQEKSERLLLNVLPGPIAERLKAGEHSIADSFSEVTVMFADVVGFTTFSASVPPAELMFNLNQIFSAFDRLAAIHHLEKIKTIGDAYMVVGGLPTLREDHAEAVAAMALDMIEEICRLNERNRTAFTIRIGINTGPVIAGVIGEKKFIYDLWGDTVNIASRMESHGHPGMIQVTESTHAKIRSLFKFSEPRQIEVKGKGLMTTHLLLGQRIEEPQGQGTLLE